MSDAVETIEEDGIVGKLFYDEYPSNPREDYDHVAVLTQLSSSFAQPDSGFDVYVIAAWDRTRDVDTIERYARAFLGAVAVGWLDDPRSDSRIFGYITQEECDRVGITDPNAALLSELDEYRDWCNGDVYGFTVEDENGEELDSCWGFYGYDYAAKELADVVHSYVTSRRDARQQMYRRLVEGA